MILRLVIKITNSKHEVKYEGVKKKMYVLITLRVGRVKMKSQPCSTFVL